MNKIDRWDYFEDYPQIQAVHVFLELGVFHKNFKKFSFLIFKIQAS